MKIRRSPRLPVAPLLAPGRLLLNWLALRSAGGLLLALACGPAPAQTWDQMIAAGDRARRDGRYADAEGSLRDALAKAQGPDQLATSLGHLAVLLQLRGQFQQAPTKTASI
jgi:hypothetical protein